MILLNKINYMAYGCNSLHKDYMVNFTGYITIHYTFRYRQDRFVAYNGSPFWKYSERIPELSLKFYNKYI